MPFEGLIFEGTIENGNGSVDVLVQIAIRVDLRKHNMNSNENTYAASLPIAMFCIFISNTLSIFSGNLMLLGPSHPMSLKRSPMEKIEFCMAYRWL